MVRRRPGQIWVKDCGEKCANNGKRYHYHRFNPNGQSMKQIEMTVWRALQLIEAWDELPGGAKWDDDATNSVYKKVFGDNYAQRGQIIELWERYKSRQLHREVLELAENLPLDDLPKTRRKELKDGFRKLCSQLD